MRCGVQPALPRRAAGAARELRLFAGEAQPDRAAGPPAPGQACAKLGGISMAITTDKEFAAANARGRQRLRTTPHAVAARYDEERGRIVVELSTGVEVAF